MNAEHGLRRWRVTRSKVSRSAWRVRAEDGELATTYSTYAEAQARTDALNRADQYAWVEARSNAVQSRNKPTP